MIRKIILLYALLLSSIHLKADEGMWLPMLLQTINADAMYSKGLKIPVDSIYNINKTSLKDAVVLFGGGCTGEIISNSGLLLTNHHCGYSQIQQHSTVEHDYLTNGFWAMNRSEELPCPGLTATFIIRMEDVSEAIITKLEGITDETKRNAKIKEISAELTKKAIEGTHFNAEVRPFYYGNKFFMIVTETFKDVRMVGAPPSGIGKFGADADNWMWPRHTGDFALFRIYANKDNKPASYAADNVPFKPRYSFPISIKGVNEDDYTMVYGFPGRTQEYLPSEAVKTIMDNTDPNRIKLRDIRLKIMDEAMRTNDTVRIQYASKYAGIENAYKKWKGEVLGLKRLQAYKRKKEFEATFSAWAQQSNQPNMITMLQSLNALHIANRPYSIAVDYYAEGIKGIEIIAIAENFTILEKLSKATPVDEKAVKAAADSLHRMLNGIYKDYNSAIDEKIFSRLVEAYRLNTPAGFAADLSYIDKKYKGNYTLFAADVFSKTHFSSLTKAESFLKDYSAKKLKKLINDPVYQLYTLCANAYSDKVTNTYNENLKQINTAQRNYMKGQMDMASDQKKNLYPDANSTLRITYGKVEGYEPRDGVIYKYYTTLDGIVEKFDSTNYDFTAPTKLLELHRKKDYGGYDTNGRLTPCFIASNHTTGGNSGSPVLNAYGQLIGTNFDRVWEGTMSDIMFDPERCRNITLDIRYTLFIIDKFAGARWLIDEMNIIK
jgi:hypothetical protein